MYFFLFTLNYREEVRSTEKEGGSIYIPRAKQQSEIEIQEKFGRFAEMVKIARERLGSVWKRRGICERHRCICEGKEMFRDGLVTSLASDVMKECNARKKIPRGRNELR